MELPIDNIQTILDNARKPIVTALSLNGIPAGETPIGLIPEGYSLKDLSAFLDKPLRKVAKVTLHDSPSFIAYVKKHAAESAIYANVDYEASSATLKAILDDNGGATNGADWREHTATYAPKTTVEYRRWLTNNGKAMSQEQFATFLEENNGDVAGVGGMPSGTEMLEMALNFEATASKKFKSKINLGTGGVQFEYVSDDTAQTKTVMKVFERFAIGIPVFLNSGTRYRIDARLKWREKDGEVKFSFELIRVDKVYEDAIKAEIETIKTETGLDVLFGSSGA